MAERTWSISLELGLPAPDRFGIANVLISTVSRNVMGRESLTRRMMI